MSDIEIPREARLIKRLRNVAKPSLSMRAAAKQAGLSEGRWRQIEAGYQTVSAGVRSPVVAPAETLARMAHVVGATPWDLREAGREDAAADLEQFQAEFDYQLADELDRLDGGDVDQEPSGHVSLQWASEQAAAALQLWPIGSRLLSSLERGTSDEMIVDVSKHLIQLSLDITEALIATMEDHPDLRAKLASPYSEAAIAVRKFADFHDRHAEPDDKLETRNFIQGFTLMANAYQHHEVSRGVVTASLKSHYEEMRRRALSDRQTAVLVKQARQHLDGAYGTGLYASPEIPDDRYVEYLAARLSSPHGGGDPDLHAQLSLDRFEYEAGMMRYRRELSEMIIFGGRIKTSTAPVEFLTSSPLPAADNISGLHLSSVTEHSVETETVIPDDSRTDVAMSSQNVGFSAARLDSVRDIPDGGRLVIAMRGGRQEGEVVVVTRSEYEAMPSDLQYDVLFGAGPEMDDAAAIAAGRTLYRARNRDKAYKHDSALQDPLAEGFSVAARNPPAGHRKGRGDQGAAGGEESQDEGGEGA